jgi:hypothetical protein
MLCKLGNKMDCMARAASMAMGTLINGADAGIAIITSAVAAANATLIRAHAVVGQVDTMATDWAQTPVGSFIGGLSLPIPLQGISLTCYHAASLLL